MTFKATIKNWKAAELQDISKRIHQKNDSKAVPHWTYPGWLLLQCGQVALQSQAAAVVEQRFHPGHVGLYQLLPFAGCLLLQSLHFFLETLRTHTHARCRNRHTVRLSLMWLCPCLTWMTIFLSARGRFLASLSASSHSLITCTLEK